jgi:hypothetical protein
VFDISTDDEPEVFTPGQVSRLVTSRRVKDFGHVHQHLVRFALCKLFEELGLPEMPFAPPESDYSDDSDNETTEHLAQFPQEQGRDTLISASGSS